MNLSIAFMQVCSTCDASIRCGLKDEGLFDLCPKIKTAETAKPEAEKEATTAVIDKEILRRISAIPNSGSSSRISYLMS